MSKERILVIEDDTRLAELLKRGLEQDGYETVVAYNGETGKKLALGQDFSLIISDIILPGINGLDLCRTIRSLKPSIPILMLTALGTTNDKVEGFEAGADDFLVIPFEFRELLARTKALLKRAGNQSDSQTTGLEYEDLKINTQSKTASRAGKEIKLTAKEFKLLEYMMLNAGRVLSCEEIAEKVWDTHFDTGTNFIDVYINYLRKKVDKPFERKLIHTRKGMGFMLE